MYIINRQNARIFNTDNLQVILISPDDETKIVGVMVDYEDYVVICDCGTHQAAKRTWDRIADAMHDGEDAIELY